MEMTHEGEETVPSTALGLNKRQLSYWLDAGYICPIQSKIGSGHGAYQFIPAEAKVARVMKDLVAFGMLPARAAVAARFVVDNGGAAKFLASFDLSITIEEIPQ
jgi:hypothetical protein